MGLDAGQYVTKTADDASTVDEAVSDAIESAKNADETAQQAAENVVQQYANANPKDWAETQRRLDKARQKANGGSTAAKASATATAFDAAVTTGLDFATDNPAHSIQDQTRGRFVGIGSTVYNRVNNVTGGKDIESNEDVEDAISSTYNTAATTYEDTTKTLGEATEGTALDNRGTALAVDGAEFLGSVGFDTLNSVTKVTTGTNLKTGDTDAEANTAELAETASIAAGPLTAATSKMGFTSFLKGADELTKYGDEAARFLDDATASDDLTSTAVKQGDLSDEIAQYTDDVTQQFSKQADDATASFDDLLKSGDDAATAADDIAATASSTKKWGGYSALGLGGLAAGGTFTTLFGGSGGGNPKPQPDNTPSDSAQMKKVQELDGGGILFRILAGDQTTTSTGYAVYLGTSTGVPHVVSAQGEAVQSERSKRALKNGQPLSPRFDSKTAAIQAYKTWKGQQSAEWGKSEVVKRLDGGFALLKQSQTTGSKTRYAVIEKTQGTVVFVNSDGDLEKSEYFFKTADAAKRAYRKHSGSAKWSEPRKLRSLPDGWFLYAQTAGSQSSTGPRQVTVRGESGGGSYNLDVAGTIVSQSKTESGDSATNGQISGQLAQGYEDQYTIKGNIRSKDISDGVTATVEGDGSSTSSKARYIVAARDGNGQVIYLHDDGTTASQPDFFKDVSAVKDALRNYLKKMQNGSMGGPTPDKNANSPAARAVEGDAASNPDTSTNTTTGTSKTTKAAAVGGVLVLGYLYSNSK